MAVPTRLPPLNAIRAFEAAGRLSSITAAANEISVTPAAISQHIKTLEAHLGVRLFVRSHRAIALTSDGARYLAEISGHLTGIRQATARLLKRAGRRGLDIQAHATFAQRWLIPRLSSFHASHPDIDVRLTTTLHVDAMEQGTVDGAIRLGNGRWKGLAAERLVANVLTPACAPDLLRRHRRLLQPGGLARETLLHSLARPDDWAAWLAAATTAGVDGIEAVDPYSGLKYESSVLAYQAAIEGQGIAIAQLALIADDLASDRLTCPYGFTLDMGAFTYYFTWPKAAEVTPQLAAFRTWLTSSLPSPRSPRASPPRAAKRAPRPRPGA